MTKIAGVVAGEYVFVYSGDMETIDLMVMPDSVGVTLSRDQAQALVNAIQGLLHGTDSVPSMNTRTKATQLRAGADGFT